MKIGYVDDSHAFVTGVLTNRSEHEWHINMYTYMYKIVTIGMNSCTKQSPPKYQRRRKKTRIEGRKTNGLYNYYVNVLCVRTNLAVVVLKADIWGCINVYVIYVIPFTTTNTKEPSFNCHAVYLIFSFSFIRISSMPVFGSAST